MMTKVFPQEFKDDANDLIKKFDPVINGGESDVSNRLYNELKAFVAKYEGEGFVGDEGKHYYITNNMLDLITMFSDLKEELKLGHITNGMVDDFNFATETMDIVN